jgi:hypothetical protein
VSKFEDIFKHSSFFQDEWTFNMEPVFEFPVQLSAFMAGKWRLTIEVFFQDDGRKTSSCRRYFGDIVEV